METSVQQADLQFLVRNLQSLLDDLPVRIQCTIRNDRLIVLGQHPEDFDANSSDIFKTLERKIQALQLTFTQQVRLYLRILGQQQPYAHRWFMIQPPPPPLPPLRAHRSVVQPSTQAAPFSMAASQPPRLAVSVEPGVVAVGQGAPSESLLESVLDQESAASLDFIPESLLESVLEPARSSLEQPLALSFVAELSPDQGHSSVHEPPSHPSTADAQESDEAPWLMDDDELDVLVHQLMAGDALAHSLAIAPFYLPETDAAAPPEGLTPNSSSFVSDPPSRLLPELGSEEASEAISPGGDIGYEDDHEISEESDESHTSALSLVSPNSSPTGTLATHVSSTQLSPHDSTYGQPGGQPQDPISHQSSPLMVSNGAGNLAESWQARLHQVRSLQQQARQQIRLLSRTMLEPLKTQMEPVTEELAPWVNGRVAIAAGVTALGLSSAIYSMTRPCAVGACPQLAQAEDLSEGAARILQQADGWSDLERAEEQLQQAVELLEPIPFWSSTVAEADDLVARYRADLVAIASLLDLEELASSASQTGQEPPISLQDWETARNLWQQVITQLEAVPQDSDLYGFARQALRDYRTQLMQAEQQLDIEGQAQAALDRAKQAAQLAQARQGVAQSLEGWQFARVTWIVAIDRLGQIPPQTLAAVEAERLMESYQTSLDLVNHRVEKEQEAVRILDEAEQRAEVAHGAEQRLDWEGAVTDWNSAIATVKQIESGTAYQFEAEERLERYSQSLAEAEEKLQMSEQIEAELEKTCIGEIRICNLLSVGRSIKVSLDDGYVAAINAARSSGNNSLQAVVTDHQLILRRALEQIANHYDLPIEVYDPENVLLERHSPRSQS